VLPDLSINILTPATEVIRLNLLQHSLSTQKMSRSLIILLAAVFLIGFVVEEAQAQWGYVSSYPMFIVLSNLVSELIVKFDYY
jgi:hypothetical protein